MDAGILQLDIQKTCTESNLLEYCSNIVESHHRKLKPNCTFLILKYKTAIVKKPDEGKYV